MSRPRILQIFIMAIAVLAVMSCKKSIEGETSKWESNKRQISELKALYPGFSKALDEQMTKATNLWSAAEGLSDEKAKIDKMAAANREIGGGWVDKLGRLDNKKTKIRNDIVRVKGMKLDENDRSSINSAANNAERTISDVDSRLSRGAISSSQANTIVSNAYNQLESALKTIDKVESNVKSKTKTAEKEKEDTKKAEEKKNAMWKCSFCDKKNAATATECGGCGAPKP